MSKPKKTAAAAKPAGEATATETPESAKPAEAKTAKKAKGKAARKPKRTADEVMPKARAADPLVVFAFRLSAEERDLIHNAAGPARASRFVRAVALAAARRDVGALQSILLEAQKEAAS